MTTWVLLRGLAREARHWGDFGKRLKARLPPQDRVVAIDLPGNGSLYETPSPADVAATVQSCRAQLASQCVAQPCIAVALSLGGMVALEWALRHPDELAGGVLINTSFRGHSPFWRRLRPGSYLALLRLLWPGTPKLRQERQILALTSNEGARHADLPIRWTAIRAGRPVSAVNALRQLAAAARFAAPPTAPPVPLLLLASSKDRLVSARCSEASAARWQAALRIHPTAGHDLPLDDPDWVIDQVLLWRTPPGQLPGPQ